MKVRLFSLAAFAAFALASQGVAQQSEDSLERALADLNDGLAAPAAQSNVTISGDFRARNRWFDDGNDTNNRDIDVRTRLNFGFQVTENARAFVGFYAAEAFGGSMAGRWDMADPLAPSNSLGDHLDRAWVAVDSLVGDGGTAKIGRSYYTPGSGRLLGSDEWDNFVTTFSGIWYDHPMGGYNFHFAMLNGVENGMTATDDMIYIAAFNFDFDMVEATGPINVAPYWIRDETASNTTTSGTHETWLGIDLSGELAGVGYEVEYTQYDFGGMGDSAWYVGLGIDFESLESLPGVESGALDVAISSAGKEFAVPGVNAVGTAYGNQYHNAAGFADILGTTGIWTTDVDTFQIGLGLVPAEGWTGRFAYINIDTAGTDYDEFDLSVGTQLNGNVAAWFGYALTDPSGSTLDNMTTFWTTLDLAFGG